MQPNNPYASADVAIIGMAGFFPGAPSLRDYWQNIILGRVTFEEIPIERWDWKLYYDPDLTVRDKINSRWGAFLPHVLFDPLHFGTPPSSLDFIETTQLLVLESTRLALADSGYLDRPFDREHTSVFIGTGAGEADLGQKYSFRSLLPHFFGQSAAAVLSGLELTVPEWNADSFTGVITNIAAGRVANRFDLGGVNCTIDAACASALAALRAGIMELRAGESAMVIAGGADTLMNPYAYTCFSKIGALSPQGRCRPFDESADGIVLGEGAGMVVLKRLADAQKDGDRVYAVIKGIAASSDGRATSLSAPSKRGQVLALRRAYRNAGIDPTTIGLIEAHGTGTKVGDQSEAAALKEFFTRCGMSPGACAVGTVKSMIGHTKCAAGIAALIKVVLALHHKVLPPTAGIEKPIAELKGADNPLYLNSRLRPWIADSRHPRRAAVSAFGFGGTNFHAVLEEVPAPTTQCPHSSPYIEWPAELLIFEARSIAELFERTSELRQQLQQLPGRGETPFALKDLAFTLACGSRDGARNARMAIVTDTAGDLIEKLEQAGTLLKEGNGEDFQHPTGIYFSQVPEAEPGEIAFVFPGQGSQYTGMLAGLGVAFDPVRQVFERFDDYLQDQYAEPLSRFIYPPDLYTNEEKKARECALTETRIAQPAVGAANVAMLALLGMLGVRPAMAAGHSYGEYVALFAADVLEEKALALISEARGRFILEAARPDPGTMAAVKASEAEVAAAIEKIEQVWIANLNAPQQTVISGSRAGIEKATDILRQKGFSSVTIPVACAFHSPIVAGARNRLREFFSQFIFSPARIPVFSNTTAGRFPVQTDADPRSLSEQLAQTDRVQTMLADQLIKPVRFVAEVEAMYAAGARVFVEAGPASVLTKLIGHILGKRPHTAVCTDLKGRHSLVQLQHALARLVVAGIDFKRDLLYTSRECRQLDLNRLTLPVEPQITPKTAYIIGQGGVRAANSEILRPPANLPRPIRFADDIVAAPTVDPGNDLKLQNQKNFSSGEIMNISKQPPLAQAYLTDNSVITRFQDLMSQFLETQKTVMTAYLNTGNGGSGPIDMGIYQAPQAPDPLPLREVISPAARRESAAAAPATSVARAPTQAVTPLPSPAPPAAQTHFDIGALLLTIVSDRTGYPADMLDLSLDIESDLGIDSIKRVQITEELVAALETNGMKLANEELANIASSVTLEEIIVKLQNLMSKTTSTTPQNKPAAAPSGFDITGTLLGIVSDLSGYPVEMLDLTLQIESDLGIDSIKRVQIMEHFVEEIEKQHLRLPDHLVADMAASGTLGEIVAKLTPIVAEPPALASPSAPAPGKNATVLDPPEPQAQGTVGDILPHVELLDLLFRVIEQHTGYPRETLAKDLSWQTDLDVGPSAKKRILTAYQRIVEEQSGRALILDPEKAVASLWVNDILDWMAAARLSPDSEHPHGEKARGQTPAINGRIRRFTLTQREQPLLTNFAVLLSGQRVLVTRLADDPLADSLVAELRALNIQPLVLAHGGNSRGQHYCCDFTSFEQMNTIIDRIRDHHGSISGLLHLVPLAPGLPFEQMQLPDWKQRLHLEVKSLFYLTKLLTDDLAAAARTGAASLVAATAMGGDFTPAAEDPAGSGYFPGSGALAGFLKTVALEIPGLNVRAVDTDPKAPAEARIVQIVNEFVTPCADVEVGYRAGRRMMLDIQEAPIDSQQAPRIDISSDWNLLVTGGGRGITATIAMDLARRCQPTFLLVGRTPSSAGEDPRTAGINDHKQLKAMLAERLKAEKGNIKLTDVESAYNRLVRQRELRQTIAQLQSTGARVHYFQVDVTDEKAFGELIDSLYTDFGHIDGVLHGAGLIEDKLVKDKDVASFARVFDTKADSLFVLSRKLRGDELRFLALFSSVAGRFGNAGQADYAAANEVYSKTALYLNRCWQSRVISLMWGPWESQGMVSAELKQKFEQSGIYLIPPRVGARCFQQEITHGAPEQAEVIFAGWDDRKSAFLPLKRTERLPVFSANANFKPRLDGQVDVIHRLEAARDVYLRDHQLDGRPVLPMAMAMEMMAEAAAYRYPDFHLKAIRDVNVYKGIILENGRKHIRIAAEPQLKSEERILLKIRIEGNRNENHLYYDAQVDLGREDHTYRPHIAIDLHEPTTYALSAAGAYQRLLFHGPLWQGIEKIQSIGKNGIVGFLKTSRPENYIQGLPRQLEWLIDPLVIDSGLQLVVLWMRHQFNTTPLPSRVEKYVQYCAPPDKGPLRCEVRVATHKSKGIKKADLFFIKPDDQLFAMIQGLEIIGSPALNRLAQK